MAIDINYSTRSFITDLTRYVGPYRRQFAIGTLLRTTSDIARLVPAWAISTIVYILSQGVSETTQDALARPFIYWALSAAYFTWAHNLAKYIGYQVAEKAALDLYKQAIKHIFRLDLAWQETENSGNKLKKIDKGLDGINVSIRRFFDTIIEVIVNIVGVTLIFSIKDAVLAISLASFAIGYFVIGTLLLKRATKQEKVVNQGFENLGGISFESVNNIHTIKSLGIDSGLLQAIEEKINVLIPEIKKRIAYFQSRGAILFVYEMIYIISMSAWISWGIVQGRYDVSVFVLFIGLYRRVETSASELTEVTQMLALAKIWVSRTMSILKIEPKIESATLLNEQLDYPPNWKQLKLQNVSFAYKKQSILKDVSLTIHRGEKVGIVGLSGAGKSTLFKLLLDLYEEYDGTISLDNYSLKDIRRQSYIDHVSVVLQDTELFDMSLRTNIEIARTKPDKATDNLLQNAIKHSHLGEVVANLPNGVETIVGEKGFKLSGGQRQRLGIARALYREPDILLLDEATSHLDAHSEKEIQKAIEENIGKFTTIVIAHRLSTLKAMDKIVVLEKGRVVEMGSFDELLKRGKQFASMWREQKI